MLTDAALERILEAIPRLTVGVLGDLFLDRYLDIDAALTQPSLETGLDAYQVVRVRASPGAAGTVVNNLVALGVGRVHVLSAIGDDGEGYELRQALGRLAGVATDALVAEPGWRTPTYTKPMLRQAGAPARELNRLDIKNYRPLSGVAETKFVDALVGLWPRLDALLVLDQVTGPEAGVVTPAVVTRLAELGERHPDKPLLADSRERIAAFRSVWLKPNRTECVRGIRAIVPGPDTVPECAVDLARHAGRPVFCTCGPDGMCVADPRGAAPLVVQVPAYPVEGPIDIVGAGDSTAAAIAGALAAGSGLTEAAAFGNLVASITIRQLGTTGTASPEQVRRRRP
jgi:bifunctional ADP-heptose synthase (sugar kinase/adenylyltransferase)